MLDIVLTWLLTQFKSNPIFVGGISTVLFSGVLYVCRGLPAKIERFFRYWFTIEITINAQSDSYVEIDSYISKHRLNFFSRTFRAHNSSVSWARCTWLFIAV